jgi:hypothetical protein
MQVLVQATLLVHEDHIHVHIGTQGAWDVQVLKVQEHLSLF